MRDPKINWPPPGRYILAVSGGADSMVLLDLFARAGDTATPGRAPTHNYDLVVAHFDHGLRPDSHADRAFVQTEAARYGLPFVHHEAHLSRRPGQGSEATARTARHDWLEATRAAHNAMAVIMAHHQDDLLETSLLNLARGTGRRGLAPMLNPLHPMQTPAPMQNPMQNGHILRPLLALTRSDLRAHAAAHHLAWREDPTNADLTNPRNFLRHQLLPHATSAWRARYLSHLSRVSALNAIIGQQLEALLAPHRTGPDAYTFPRTLVRDLSPAELEELILAAAYNLRPGIELDRRLIQEMVMFTKTGSPQSRRPLRQGLNVVIGRDHVALKST